MRKRQTPSTPPKKKKSVEDWMQDDDTKTNISDDEMGLCTRLVLNIVVTNWRNLSFTCKRSIVGTCTLIGSGTGFQHTPLNLSDVHMQHRLGSYHRQKRMEVGLLPNCTPKPE